jgi:hypothetical protein
LKGSWFTKHSYNNGQTIDFRKHRIVLSFYDKRAELIKNKGKKIVASKLDDQQMLRYEMRLFKLLPRTLKLANNRIHVCDLKKRKVHKKIIKLWYNEYKAITKSYKGDFLPTSFSKFMDYLIALGINNITDVHAIGEAWLLDKNQNINQKKYLYTKLNKALQHPIDSKSIMFELDNKIKKARDIVLSSI